MLNGIGGRNGVAGSTRREPPHRDQVARRLRDARRDDPRRGAPGAQSLTLDRDSSHEKARLASRYAELVYFGQWFSPLRDALDAFMTALMPTVTGSVTLKLYKGSCLVVGRTSPYALYSTSLASFDMTGFTPKDSEGFIRLFASDEGRERLSKDGTPYQPWWGARGETTPREAGDALGRTVFRAASGSLALNDSFAFDRELLENGRRPVPRVAEALGGRSPLPRRDRDLVRG